MKKIPLTQGQFAIVDDEDFEWLNQFKWCAHWNPGVKSFYAYRGGKTKDGKWHSIYMAREILELKQGDKRQADHIYHNTLDNRKAKLRIVTNQQNSFNHKDNKGYSWHKHHKKYLARIRINDKLIFLGYFTKEEDARKAYLQAKKQYHIM